MQDYCYTSTQKVCQSIFSTHPYSLKYHTVSLATYLIQNQLKSVVSQFLYCVSAFVERSKTVTSQLYFYSINECPVSPLFLSRRYKQ